jgi:hypothetical protein
MQNKLLIARWPSNFEFLDILQLQYCNIVINIAIFNIVIPVLRAASGHRVTDPRTDGQKPSITIPITIPCGMVESRAIGKTQERFRPACLGESALQRAVVRCVPVHLMSSCCCVARCARAKLLNVMITRLSTTLEALCRTSHLVDALSHCCALAAAVPAHTCTSTCVDNASWLWCWCGSAAQLLSGRCHRARAAHTPPLINTRTRAAAVALLCCCCCCEPQGPGDPCPPPPFRQLDPCFKN